MAASETAIANMALRKVGQNKITDIDGTDILSVKVHAIYDQERDELLTEGPKEGWKFAKMTYHGIDRESASFTSVADGGSSTCVFTCSSNPNLVAGDMVEIDGTVYDGDYDVSSVTTSAPYTVTVSETYSATDTGTLYWTSEQYLYRFAIPTCKSVRAVLVAGVELTDWVKRGAYILTNEESSEVDMEIVKSVTDVTLFPDYFVKVLVLRIALQLLYDVTQDLKAIQALQFELEKMTNKAIAMDEAQQYVRESSSSWVNIGHTTETIE